MTNITTHELAIAQQHWLQADALAYLCPILAREAARPMPSARRPRRSPPTLLATLDAARAKAASNAAAGKCDEITFLED